MYECSVSYVWVKAEIKLWSGRFLLFYFTVTKPYDNTRGLRIKPVSYTHLRDNFNFRVGLGRISELGYGMLFGSDVKKQFFQKRIKGRGYCDVGTSVISEFYTPLVPKGHDFLQTIGRLAQDRQVMPEQQEKE